MSKAQRQVNRNMQYKPPQPGQQIEVDLENATQRVCGECGCKYFQPAVMIYIVSALMNRTGQELTAQQPVLICLDCKKPLGVKEG